MACTLRFVGRDSGGVKNLLYITDTTNTGMVGYIITLNGNTIYSDGITAPHAAGSTISLSAPNTDGVITNGTYHVYQRIIGESAYENDFVLSYTIPANTLSLTIDGYSSTVVCRDSTLYTGLTVSNYLLTHSQPTVGDTTSLTTPFTIPSTIYAGTHTLYLTADVTWGGTDVSLNDYVTHSTTAVAYKLDEDTIMDAVDALKESYRVNLQVNRSEARNQKVLIDEIDIYEDDYWLGIRRNDSLTSYLSLLKIYDILNEDLVASGEIIPYSTHESRISYLETFPTVINTDDSLVGNGTTIEPLGHNPADTTITGLKSDESAGGEVPATLYNWFKSVYSSLVDSSVKSWIIGIVTQLKWLTDNIGGGGYLLKYTVPADTNAISLTVDKNGQPFNFVEGDKIEIVAKFAFNPAAEPRLRLNNVISDVYRYGAFGFTSFGIVTIGRATFGGVIELTVLNNEVYGFSSIINETDTTRNTNTYALKTVGINQSAITSFQFFCSNASHQYLAGSQILIRKK